MKLADDCPEKLSLLLLTLPAMTRLHEAVEMLLQNPRYVHVLVPYAKHICGRRLPDWQTVCDAVLRRLSTATVAPASTDARTDPRTGSAAVGVGASQRQCLRVYNALLEHLVVALDPYQFLSLLPDDGSARFFLPFIHRSFAGLQLNLLKHSMVKNLGANPAVAVGSGNGTLG